MDNLALEVDRSFLYIFSTNFVVVFDLMPYKRVAIIKLATLYNYIKIRQGQTLEKEMKIALICRRSWVWLKN